MGLANFQSLTCLRLKINPGTVAFSQNNIEPTDVRLLKSWSHTLENGLQNANKMQWPLSHKDMAPKTLVDES